MSDLWLGLPAWAQDVIVAAALLLPLPGVALVLTRGYVVRPLVGALVRRHLGVNAIFAGLVAVALGLGVGLVAQERGLRQGSADAAAKFDVVIAAPGSEVAMLLATVFLQPTDAPLLDGRTVADVAAHPRAAFVAPLAFGDSWRGFPVVGTTAAFLAHLTHGAVEEGRLPAAEFEAVAGAAVPAAPGDAIAPSHGHGSDDPLDVHADEIEVVGRMAHTGTPWDRAVVTTTETMWRLHGLGGVADPRAPGFDAGAFPGTPALVVGARTLGEAYAIRSRFAADPRTMAFFPGAVLSDLHRVMGNARAAMSAMILVSQALVAVAVIVGLAILTQLFRRQIALLGALGAPARFVAATVWSHAAALLTVGAVAGLVLGYAAAWGIGRVLSERLHFAVPVTPGWPELHLVAGFVGLSAVVALVPALIALRQPVLRGLRG